VGSGSFRKINVKISLRLDLGIPTLSQTARKDGAPAAALQGFVQGGLNF
jgi:hypothetical protein